MCDFGEGTDAAAGADGGAVKGGGGAGEFEFAGRVPVVEEGVDEGGVENVASAGGVRNMDIKSRRIVEIGAVEGEYSVVAERGGGEFVGELFVDELEGFRKVRFAGDAAGNVLAGDEEIYLGKQDVNAWIKIIEVGDDGNLRGAGPFGGE